VSIGATSAPRSIAFWNYSGAASGPLTVSVTGADGPFFHFANDSCGPGVASTSSCNVDVAFAPTTTRAYSATLLLKHGATTLVIESLRGRGSAITITPNQVDFGSWFYGTSSPEHLFTVTNTGPRTRHLAVDLEPDDDASTNWILTTNHCTAALDPGKSCTIGVTFSSQIVHLPPDLHHATVYVCDLDHDCETVAQDELTATGLPVVEVTGETDFGTVTVGTPVSHTFTVTNLSPNATGPLTVSVAGFAEEDTTLTANTCDGVSVAPAASCTVDLTMTPPEATTFAASLFVRSSVVLTAGVTLTVTGVAP
jgi:hypothetical protein